MEQLTMVPPALTLSWAWTPSPAQLSDLRGHPGYSQVPISEKTWGPSGLKQEQRCPCPPCPPKEPQELWSGFPETPSPPGLHLNASSAETQGSRAIIIPHNPWHPKALGLLGPGQQSPGLQGEDKVSR